MANNFLNRKKLDLNLVNRDGYKKDDIKRSFIHPFMKFPIKHIPSTFSTNPNLLGFCVPHMNNKDVLYEDNEKFIFIDSSDRDFNINPNPYKLTVKLGVNAPGLVISHPPIKRIKYINIDNIILPYLQELVKETLVNDNTFNSLLNSDISNNIIKIDGEYTINGKQIQVCSLKVTNKDNWEINYTENRVNTTVFNIVKNTTYNSYKYTIGTNYVSDKTIFIKIENINSNFLSTNQNNFLKQLYPKKIIADSMWLNIKKSNIIFKNSDLLNINNLMISFVNQFGNELLMYHLDYNAIGDKYTNGVLYSSPSYYIRHPLYKKWQTHLTLKLGIIEPYLKQFNQ